ncbi:M20/M25/M40 family metallo-hydrolase [Pseudonocardia humida]|uniref:M20/M25/M40 family metallo-hydrolase n=1 Tax=Pseudonocardia humida TaxID=2800819 RepID=A0ABT0ZZZ9_9PSEU|nr:M20/M25/M40 family metallo-hydrolase [Pseudonocardia humida]MCO1656319.1 M20/M25/M40 family metallo-hydrolase [Pseudonocardia humida]
MTTSRGLRGPRPNSGSTRSRIGLAAVGISIVLAGSACGTGAVEAPPTEPGTASSAATGPGPSGSTTTAPEHPLVQRLSGEVSVAAAVPHLQALQRIADENGGNRATGTPGYAASVEYVAGVLREAGFEVSTPTYETSDDDDAPVRGRNVIAQTRTGDPGRVVMIGAHLDSVPEGPGIVDNGSGVASLLEIAGRLGAEPDVRNAVRFAFFDDEESGAVGSAAYVEGLSDEERGRIRLYLNVDMVASPNAGYFAQGGAGDDPETAGPAGSATIGRVLADQLARTGAADPEIIEFVGDDESPFIEAGIPVGGAENGDDEEKTSAQAGAWGGEADQVYDRCYHQACDRVENVNQEVLGHYLPALAGTLAHFATSAEELG